MAETLDFAPTTFDFDWSEPTELPALDSTEELPVFPVSALGYSLSNVAHAAQEKLKFPLPLIAHAFMAAANFAVQGHADTLCDGSRKPISLYLLTTAESGEGKSTADRWAMGPVDKFVLQSEDVFKVEYEEYEREIAYWSARFASITRTEKDRQKAKAKISELGPKPEKPLQSCRKFGNATKEGIYENFKTGFPSQILLSSDAGEFTGGAAFNEENQLKTAASLSLFWDGGTQDAVRKGDGSSTLRNRRLAAHLMAQGEVMASVLSSGILQSQGLLNRCLLTFPKSTVGNRMRVIGDTSLIDDQAYSVYVARMEQILNTPLPLRSGSRNELDPRVLPLSQDARKLWVAYSNEIEQQLGERCRLAPIRGFACRAAEHASRIAGTLQLFENLHSSDLGLDAMHQGIELSNFYISEWLRLCSPVSRSSPEYFAQVLLSWLHQKKHKIISLAEITGRGPVALRVAGAARKALEMLGDYGWLKPVGTRLGVDGVKRRNAFAVHPKVYSTTK